MFLAPQAHDNQPHASRDCRLGYFLRRRSNRYNRFDVDRPPDLGRESLDLSLGQLELSAIVGVDVRPQTFEALDRSYDMKNHQADAECPGDSRSG
jgi:hypothetical protein